MLAWQVSFLRVASLLKLITNRALLLLISCNPSASETLNSNLIVVVVDSVIVCAEKFWTHLTTGAALIVTERVLVDVVNAPVIPFPCTIKLPIKRRQNISKK